MPAELPIACSLKATELPARLAEITTLGDDALIDVHRALGHAELRFAAGDGIRDRVEAIVHAEAHCCAFLNIEVREEPDLVVLRIIASPDADLVLAELVDAFRGELRVARERRRDPLPAQSAAPLVTRAGDPWTGRMDAREWRRWEQLIIEHGIVIDRPRGHAHPPYPNMIYPCDYGHVPDTSAPGGEDVDVFVGPVPTGLVGLIVLTHQPSGVSEPKLLMNLPRADADQIFEFLDRGDPRPDLRLVWREPAP
jgi:inorganic pyrophosphatase